MESKYSQEEIERFMKEREKIRRIIGQIGGIPTKKDKVINIIFIVLVILAFAAAPFFEGTYRWVMIDVAILLVSLKISFLINNEIKVNHFEFWILSSMEWKINEISREIKEIKEELEKIKDK